MSVDKLVGRGWACLRARLTRVVGRVTAGWEAVAGFGES